MKFVSNISWVSVWLPCAGALVAVVLLSGCGVPKAEHEQAIERAERALEAVRVEGEKSIEKLRAELEVERSKAEESKGALEAEVKRLSGEGESATEALDELKREFEAYKKAYRVTIRGKAKGLSIEELRTMTGKVFRGVTVRSLDAKVISFMHDSGSGTIELSSLEPAFQQMLGYNAEDSGGSEAAVGNEPIPRGAGGVANISDSWERLAKEAAKENTKIRVEIEANSKRRDAIVAQMRSLNFEIVRLDNEIIRSGSKTLREKKRQLETQYSKLGARLGNLE